MHMISTDISHFSDMKPADVSCALQRLCSRVRKIEEHQNTLLANQANISANIEAIFKDYKDVCVQVTENRHCISEIVHDLGVQFHAIDKNLENITEKLKEMWQMPCMPGGQDEIYAAQKRAGVHQ